MKYSVLDLAPLRQGQTFKEAIDDLVQLAQETEQMGYERFWIAEHHNMSSVASSATQLLIQRTLDKTQRIRVGSGGVMLPNHSPYLVAEQYGTLETLYPGRVDLGLGRAPGTDGITAKAIRRTDSLYPNFEKDLAELRAYFEDTAEVHAFPAAGLEVPFYILGSSTDSAYLAAELGLPYAFASHFAPRMLQEAVAIYRHQFKPSKYLSEPYVIVGVNAILADTDEDAKRLATTQVQSFLNIVTSTPAGLTPPVASEEEVWKNYIAATKVPHFGPVAFEEASLIHQERSIVAQMTAMSLIGSPETVSQQVDQLQKAVDFDEVMVNSNIYDAKAQAYSYQLLAAVLKTK